MYKKDTLVALTAFVLVAAVALVSDSAHASGTADATFPSCLVAGDNGVARVALTPQTGWTSVRLYFQHLGPGGEHFVEMIAGSGGTFWGVLPRPVAATLGLKCRIVARNENGDEVSTEAVEIPVSPSCVVGLTGDERRAAANLVIGDTLAEQQGKVVAGFQCDGIVSRLGTDGKLRTDEGCREVALAAAGVGAGVGAGAGAGAAAVVGPAVLAGVVAGGVAVVSQQAKPEGSPSKP